MQGTIISGFAGIGKTTLQKKYPSEVIDLESSDFKWIYLDDETANTEKELRKGVENRQLNPKWPNNYLEVILSKIQQYRYVLIAQGNDIRNLLDDNKIDYTLAFPSMQCKDEYVERYKSRGNNDKFVSLIEKNFDVWIGELLKCPQRKIIIQPGKNFEDEMQKLGLLGKSVNTDVQQR